MAIGVYKITNTNNRRVYIGQSANISRRFSRHRWELKHNRHTDARLQADWNLYGSSVFTFDVIEECAESELLIREAYWIKFYGGINGGLVYNMLSCEDGHIPATIDKIHNTLVERYQHNDHPTKGRIVSEEERLRMSISRKGHKHSEATKEKIRQGNIGKHLSEETKDKIRQARLGKPGNRKGVHLSEEHKAKLRNANLGRKLSLEQRLKLKESHQNQSGKYVKQISKSGEVVAIYDSISKASKCVEISSACICETCRGNQQTAKGYIWEYCEKEEFDRFYATRE